jgi:septal ring factor EnvC (AmiA/AmiB activator)
MDFLTFAKAASELGMTGLALLISAGLAWVIVHRETNGLSQLKGAIEALSRAVEALNTQNAGTAAFLQVQATKSEALATDLKEVKDDLNLIKTALISVGVKSLTKD